MYSIILLAAAIDWSSILNGDRIIFEFSLSKQMLHGRASILYSEETSMQKYAEKFQSSRLVQWFNAAKSIALHQSQSEICTSIWFILTFLRSGAVFKWTRRDLAQYLNKYWKRTPLLENIFKARFWIVFYTRWHEMFEMPRAMWHFKRFASVPSVKVANFFEKSLESSEFPRSFQQRYDKNHSKL